MTILFSVFSKSRYLAKRKRTKIRRKEMLREIIEMRDDERFVSAEKTHGIWDGD